MPRKTRMYLPSVTAHIVQRGHNRNAVFFCEDDYRFNLERLCVGLRRCEVTLHAYVSGRNGDGAGAVPLVLITSERLGRAKRAADTT